MRGVTIAVGELDSGFVPVRDVELSLGKGETLAIVGESGSGKSLTGLAVMGLLPAGVRLRSGHIRLAGRNVPHLDAASLRELRGKIASM
ncbi:MAG: ATP-binding cassette domain-containing protein, partial [Methylobacteriaceae bacterium]|nr:ATP-binding cassette domain-containing protein [Methylobacteriaceae bacterium]